MSKKYTESQISLIMGVVLGQRLRHKGWPKGVTFTPWRRTTRTSGGWPYTTDEVVEGVTFNENTATTSETEYEIHSFVENMYDGVWTFANEDKLIKLNLLGKHQCNCDEVVLFNRGCQCGGV